MLIKDEYIEKVKAIKLEQFAQEEMEQICMLQKELLLLSKNKNNSDEVGILVSLVDWSKQVIFGTDTGISIRNNLHALEVFVNAPKNSLMFFHNHPKNRIFSERDLASFLTADAIILMGVVCNNGNQYFLSKLDDYNKEKALTAYNEIYSNAAEGKAIKEFLRICSKVGLEFKFGGV